MTGFRAAALAASASILALAAPALAQQATPAVGQAAAATEETPAEIVVTAQKRTERLQDVPVAVSVLGGDLIANQGGINLESAQYLVPALNFRKSGTSLNQALFLRGVGTINFSIAAEPSVATVLDGVVLSRAGEGFTDLVDIERIEVLRGPQGTLYGKNVSAGVINIVSRRPTDRLEGYAEASYFDKNEWRGRAAINLPFSANVRGRFTGFYGSYDGNIFNATLNRQVNGYERYGARGIIEADANERVRFTVIADYRRAKDDCCAEAIGTGPLSAAAGSPLLSLPVFQFARGNGTRVVTQHLVTRTLETNYGVSLQGDFDGGDVGTVTSITAYRIWNNREIRDGDFLDQAYTAANQLHDDGPQRSKTFSQELRLTSPGNQLVEYTVGAFYSWAKSDRQFARRDVVCAPVAGATGLIPCGSALAQPSTFPSAVAQFGSVFKNLAAFGQATVNLSERFRLIGGLRYTFDQLDVNHIRNTALAGPGINPTFDAGVFNGGLTTVNAAGQTVFVPGAPNGRPYRNKTTASNLSGRAGFQFDIVPESTVYATFSRGYKGPAFNIFFNLTTPAAFPISPETADAYEVGLKNSLLDGRLTVNIAGFYAKYKNYQANSPTLTAGVLTTQLTNAGDISTRGFEVDVIARPIEDLSISGGVAYADARVDQFRAPPIANPAGIVPNGTPLANAPRWKASGNADYRIRTGGAFDVNLGASASYQSSQLSQFDPNPTIRAIATIGAYTLVDLRAALVDRDDRWSVQATVRNLLDTSFAASIASGGPGGSYRYIVPREADRYWGVTLRYNFGR